MQQCCRGLASHAPIAIRSASDYILLQAQHAAHSGDAVERGNEMHLAGAGVGKTQFHAAIEQAVHKTFGTIHTSSP